MQIDWRIFSGRVLDWRNVSTYLDITESDAFAFEVDDVDKAQSQNGYLETQFDEAKTALAESADAFVGTMAKEANADMMSVSLDISTLTSFLTPIDQAHIKLYTRANTLPMMMKTVKSSTI